MLSWINQNIGLFTILAILVAPIVALQIQKKTEDYKERKSKKLGIFKTLMATRANMVSLEHVQALNMIDIEFYNEKQIKNSWNIYRDHLNSHPYNQSEDVKNQWLEKGYHCLIDLLYEMSKFFDYNFNKVMLKNELYVPKAHQFVDVEQNIIRSKLVDIVTGNQPINVQLVQNKADKTLSQPKNSAIKA